MEKTSYLRPLRTRVREYLTPSRNFRHGTFKNPYTMPGMKYPFNNKWHTLIQMHDMKLWTIAYAPMKKNNI